MIIPIRCFTCGKPIAGKWGKYKKLKEKYKEGEALDILGLKRICCRRIFIAHKELINDVLKYKT